MVLIINFSSYYHKLLILINLILIVKIQLNLLQSLIFSQLYYRQIIDLLLFLEFVSITFSYDFYTFVQINFPFKDHIPYNNTSKRKCKNHFE